MSHEESDDIETWMATYSGRNLKAIILCAFLAGGWATKLQWDISDIRMNVSAIKAAQESMQDGTEARIKDWTAWRRDVDDGKLKSIGDRFTVSDFDMAATIFNMRVQPALMPYVFEVKRAQGK
jgi:hypothetical protein